MAMALWGVLVIGLLAGSVCGEATGPVEKKGAGGDPCSCALLNFWDPVPREDTTECCKALRGICDKENSIHCGHVHRFCLKHRAGYSAWVLDQFVNDSLRPLNCPQYNADATHDDACGDGWCRIGYACSTVRADRCRKKTGIKCGKGFCRDGTSCGEMSSEVCKQVTLKEVEAMKKSGESVKDVKCKENDKCTLCATQTDYECISEKEIADPCLGKGCADFIKCGLEEEKVCTVRPDAAPYLGKEAPEIHEPEKVKSKLRRFTAFIFPIVGVVVGVILIIALLSWGSIRVRQAKKEAALDNDEQGDEQGAPQAHGQAQRGVGSMSEFDFPLSPGRAQSRSVQKDPRLHLPLGGAKVDGDATEPFSGRRSGRSALSGGRRIWTPRSGYQSMADQEMDTPVEMPTLQDTRYRTKDTGIDYDGDYSDC